MEFNEYQETAALTNCYPEELMLECLVLGLCSEAGEVAGKLKKWHRGDKTDKAFEDLIRKELSDCLWYIANISSKMGFKLEHIAIENIMDLNARVERGTIKGSGDDR